MAGAFGVDLVVSPEIAAILALRPLPPEIMAVRMCMARIPRGGGLIDNPLGPRGFYIGNVYVMAGIPRVMRGSDDAALDATLSAVSRMIVALGGEALDVQAG